MIRRIFVEAEVGLWTIKSHWMSSGLAGGICKTAHKLASVEGNRRSRSGFEVETAADGCYPMALANPRAYVEMQDDFCKSSDAPPFRQRMPREVQPTSRGLSFPHKLPQTRRLAAFSPAVLSVLWRNQKPPQKPKILRKSSSLFSAFQDLSPTPSLAPKMQ